jgi:hypothetical protein
MMGKNIKFYVIFLFNGYIAVLVFFKHALRFIDNYNIFAAKKFRMLNRSYFPFIKYPYFLFVLIISELNDFRFLLI